MSMLPTAWTPIRNQEASPHTLSQAEPLAYLWIRGGTPRVSPWGSPPLVTHLQKDSVLPLLDHTGQSTCGAEG